MTFKDLLFVTSLTLMGSLAHSYENDDLYIDVEQIPVRATASLSMEELDEIFYGWVVRLDETRAFQMDVFDNPAFVFVGQAIDLFSKVEGRAEKSCENCHEDIEAFAGLRAIMPRVRDAKLQSMEKLVNGCRTERMDAKACKWSYSQMTARSALIGLQSGGMPVNVRIDGKAAQHWEAAKALYHARVGQLDM